METFWDYSVWGTINLIGILLISLLAANLLKQVIRPLKATLLPASVLGGLILLVFAGIYRLLTGQVLFDTPVFGSTGSDSLEIITYHALALGFIATTLRSASGKFTKQRGGEILNTGLTTVSTYLLQGIFGLVISLITAALVPGFFVAAGSLLPFGFGQGTGQALNYGGIYEYDFGFEGGKSFGLAIAAIGFLCASIGGVIYLNYLKRKGRISISVGESGTLHSEEIQGDGEIPMHDSMDKMTIQIAMVALVYLLTYLLMFLLGLLLPGMRSLIYGFNFLIGVLAAAIFKGIINGLKKRGAIKKEYFNSFLLKRVGNFFFDLMVVAGIAAIRLRILMRYWPVLAAMAVVGLVITFLYNHYIAKKLFPAYQNEQFLMMYGMLTGTASTGIILLREIDPAFTTPAAENMVYQNFPAIVFGFPLMFLATLSPVKPVLTILILIALLAVLNLILFRSVIFKRGRKV